MNNAREKIIRYYKAGGDEMLAARLCDLAETAAKSRRYAISAFLDPYGLSVAETVAAHFAMLRLEFEGGFVGAERVKAAFVDNEYRGELVYDIIGLEIKWDKRFYSLAHRDVLGAVLGLGCEREVIGDIVLGGEGAQLVAGRTAADFLLGNLTAVGAANVSVKEIDFSELKQKEEKIKDIKATVAALRLDAVAAAGYGVSRSYMAEEIKAQRVKINWKAAKNGAQPVRAGDVVSFRGRGRVEVAEIGGLTKKGRISICLRRYI
ncbi:MAG: RNA-binding protein [Acidaminococcales bacterium]|jgi:RNA-binding protein YlmH|nr:RNA-binding protein [Acidaminococcales bacterium]